MQGRDARDTTGPDGEARELHYDLHHHIRRVGSSYFSSPHNDPLVVELKVANALTYRILINTKSSVDIITWDYLKRLKHPGREIVPLIHAILGFRGQEANPVRVIWLSLQFRDKSKA